VQRHRPCKLPYDNIGDEGGRGHAAVKQPGFGRRLDYGAFTGPARVFGTDRAKHAYRRRHAIERLELVLADAMKPACAAGTRGDLRFDNLGYPWQMLRQEADIPLRFLPRQRRCSRLPLSGPVLAIVADFGSD